MNGHFLKEKRGGITKEGLLKLMRVKKLDIRRQSKKLHIQGTHTPRNAAYVRYAAVGPFTKPSKLYASLPGH